SEGFPAPENYKKYRVVHKSTPGLTIPRHRGHCRDQFGSFFALNCEHDCNPHTPTFEQNRLSIETIKRIQQILDVVDRVVGAAFQFCINLFLVASAFLTLREHVNRILSEGEVTGIVAVTGKGAEYLQSSS